MRAEDTSRVGGVALVCESQEDHCTEVNQCISKRNIATEDWPTWQTSSAADILP